MAVLIGAATIPPRRLLPAALGVLVVIGLLHHAQGGAPSGYTPLVALPLIWLPVGGPLYPP